MDQHVVGQEVGDLGQVGRAGRAVGEGDAVDEDRRGEPAQHEVLERRLARLGPLVVEGGQHVERDRQDLEAQEHDDQVVGLAHEDGPGRRDHGQHVQLGPLGPLPLEVALGHQGRERHGHGHEHGDEHAEPVDHHRVGDRRVGPAVLEVGPLPPGQAEGGERDQRGSRSWPPAAGAGWRTSEDTARSTTRAAQHHDDRQDRQVPDVGTWMRGACGGRGGVVGRVMGRWPRRARRLVGPAPSVATERLVLVGDLLDVGDQLVDRRGDAVEDRLGVHAEQARSGR